MNLSNLNWRHKAGLFLVLFAAGLSPLLEASARQTAVIILLGLTTTWLLGSLRLRVLWLVSSVVSCVVGVSLVAVPVLKDWNSYQVSAQDYDRAIADLREAVTKAHNSAYAVQDTDGTEGKLGEFPPTIQKWLQPDPANSPIDRTKFYLLPDMPVEEAVSEFQNILFLHRPTFSFRASSQLSYLIGLALLTAGLFSLGWFARSVLRATR